MNFNTQTLEIHGTSMSPFIREGDLITYSSDLRAVIGDIVLYRSSLNKEWISHRITHSNPVTLKGDACLSNDPEEGEIWGVGIAMNGKLLPRNVFWTSRFISTLSQYNHQKYPRILRYSVKLFLVFYLSLLRWFILHLGPKYSG